jgi:hypothetical protein
VTGPEHFDESQRCAVSAASPCELGCPVGCRHEELLLMAAQVHAMLGLTAAIISPHLTAGSLLKAEEDAWQRVLQAGG